MHYIRFTYRVCFLLCTAAAGLACSNTNTSTADESNQTLTDTGLDTDRPWMDSTMSHPDTGVVDDTNTPPDGQSNLPTDVAHGSETGVDTVEMDVPTELPIPQGLTATATNTPSIRLDWEEVEGAERTVVWRRVADTEPEMLATVNTTSYEDTSVAYDVTYIYSIQAEQQDGLLSERSVEVSAVVPLPLPAPPDGLSAMAGDRQVQLSWEPTEFADTYTVARALSREGPFVEQAVLTETSYVDMEVSNRETYIYTVQGSNRAGTGLPSEEASATPYAQRRWCIGGNGLIAATTSSPEGAAPPVALWGDRFGRSLRQGRDLAVNRNTGEVLVLNNSLLTSFPGDSNDGALGIIPWTARPRNVAYNAMNNTLTLSFDTHILTLSPPFWGSSEPMTRRLEQPGRTIALDDIRNQIIAIDRSDDQAALLFFSGDAVGTEGPLRTIAGPLTTLVAPTLLAIDTEHDEIWVADISDSRLMAFALGSEGDVAPLRTIHVPPSFWDIAYDSLRDEVLMVSSGEAIQRPILAYDRTAQGDAVPTRTITGDAVAAAVRIEHNPVYDTLLVLTRGADEFNELWTLPGDSDGDTAPLRVVGDNPALSQTQGLAFDPEHQTLWMAAGTEGVFVYDANTPNSEALQMLPAGNGGFDTASNVALDRENQEVYVADVVQSTITVYPMDAQGPTTPHRTIAGPTTGLMRPQALLFDAIHGELIVINNSSQANTPPSILSFPRGAEGDTAPLRTLTADPLIGPSALAFDPTVGELFVGDFSDDSVQVYAWPAQGHVDPLRVLKGPLTELDEVQSIAIDPLNRELLVVSYPSTLNTFALDAEGDTTPLNNTQLDTRATLPSPRGLVMCDPLP